MPRCFHTNVRRSPLYLLLILPLAKLDQASLERLLGGEIAALEDIYPLSNAATLLLH